MARSPRLPARVAGFAVALVVAFGSVLLGWAMPSSAAEPGVNLRRIDTSEWPKVKVNVLYTGEVPDLRSIVVRQDGKVVPAASIRIEPLAKTTTPVGVVLAIDTSGSMQGDRLREAKAAAKRFVETKSPTDQIAVVAFSDAPRVASGLSADAAGALAAIDSLEARGETALWDAVSRSAELLAGQPALLPYIVLLSDGANSVPTGTTATAAAAANRAAAPVFSVGLQGGREFDAAGLQALATATSGRYDETASAGDLERLYGEVQGVLQNQYELAWTSAIVEAETVDVSITFGTARAAATAAVNSVVRAPSPPQDVRQRVQLPFVSGALGAYVVAGLIGLAAAAAVIGVIVVARPGERNLESIVAEYTGSGGGREQDEARRGFATVEVSEAVGRLIDSVAARAGGADLMERFDKRLDQADIKVQPQEAVLLGSLVVVVMLGVGLAAGGPLVGLTGAIVGGLLPAAAVNFRAERRKRSFVNQLPDTLNLLASSLRAGFSLLQGLDAVSQEVEAPMGRELRRVVLESRLGRPLEDALEETAQRMGSPDFEWVVMAINIQREVGGNLAELLTTVADTMVSREQLRREVSALTAEGKLSAVVVGVMPVILAVAISVLNPGYLTPLFTTAIGKVMLLGATVLALAGFLWMRKTIQIDI